jgi:hypothetical protein
MRIPLQIKCLVLCVTVLSLAHSRIHFYSPGFTVQQSKKVKQFGKQDRLYGEDENGSIKLKRKRKPKGRPLAEALITDLNIRQIYHYSEFSVSTADSSFSSPAHKAHCKRGPPLYFL